MPALLITYDKKNQWLNFGALVRAIKKYEWVQLTDSSYAIATNATPQEVFEILRQNLDDSTNLYVMSIRKPFTGFGPPKVNDWMVRHMGH
jgi:hypothetical protein